MLLHDDVVADGEAKAGAFSARLGREEWVEYLFFHVRRDAGAIVAEGETTRMSRFTIGPPIWLAMPRRAEG